MSSQPAAGLQRFGNIDLRHAHDAPFVDGLQQARHANCLTAIFGMIKPCQRRIELSSRGGGRHRGQIVIAGNDLPLRVKHLVIEAIVHVELEAVQHHPGHIHLQLSSAHHQPLGHRPRRRQQGTIVGLRRRLQRADVAIKRGESPQQDQRQAEKQQQLGIERLRLTPSHGARTQADSLNRAGWLYAHCSPEVSCADDECRVRCFPD